MFATVHDMFSYINVRNFYWNCNFSVVLERWPTVLFVLVWQDVNSKLWSNISLPLFVSSHQNIELVRFVTVIVNQKFPPFEKNLNSFFNIAYKLIGLCQYSHTTMERKYCAYFSSSPFKAFIIWQLIQVERENVAKPRLLL